MKQMTSNEFNAKYYIDYKENYENGVIFENGKMTVGEGNLLEYTDLFITDAETGKEYYQSKQFTCLMEELEKFCNQVQIKIIE